MKTRAIQRNIHVSARKAGLVCDLIRNKPVKQALTILENTDKKTSAIIRKILNSAIANATTNHAMLGEKLYIYQIFANEGKTIKRSLPRAKGSAHMIRKRHCHIEIWVSDDHNQKALDANKTNVVKKAPKVDPNISVVKKPAEQKVIKKELPKVNLAIDDNKGGEK